MPIYRALIKIGDVRKTCDGEAEGALKAAERAVRDVVVLRCCAPGGIGTISHDDILPALEVAFDKPLQGELKLPGAANLFYQRSVSEHLAAGIETIEILNGLKYRFEEHHGVKYAPEALEAAATLSARHINDRHLPDKAIDVIDEAGARQRLLDLVQRARSAFRAQGLAPGSRVALLGPNSGKWVACDLALMAEGLISVPLYTRQAPQELVGMLKDCDARILLAPDSETLELASGEQGAHVWRRRRATARPALRGALFYRAAQDGCAGLRVPRARRDAEDAHARRRDQDGGGARLAGSAALLGLR